MVNSTIKKMESVLERAKDDSEKFYEKKNSSAGTRLRSSMQELKNLAQEVRIDVQEVKKDR